MSEPKNMMEVHIPEEILLRLQHFCLEHGIGFAMLRTDRTIILHFGLQSDSPDFSALIGAHSLITGILTGEWEWMNEIAQKLNDTQVPKNKKGLM